MRLLSTISVASTIWLSACCYTGESVSICDGFQTTQRHRLALLSDNYRDAYHESEHCSPDSVKLAGVGVAGWRNSAPMAAAIAAPDLIGVFSRPVDNITTQTKGK